MKNSLYLVFSIIKFLLIFYQEALFKMTFKPRKDQSYNIVRAIVRA